MSPSRWSSCCLLAAVVACETPEDDAGHAEHEHDATAEDDDADAGPSGCAAEDRDDVYTLGLERSGEHVMVRFVDAMPAPPARFDNTWVLDVLDPATGMPLDDAELTVEPYMPDHNHGTSIQCNVEKMAEPGRVMLEPVNLFMPGLWDVRLHFAMADGTSDLVVFRFCVDP
jgi:hypothetical protein